MVLILQAILQFKNVFCVMIIWLVPSQENNLWTPGIINMDIKEKTRTNVYVTELNVQYAKRKKAIKSNFASKSGESHLFNYLKESRNISLNRQESLLSSPVAPFIFSFASRFFFRIETSVASDTVYFFLQVFFFFQVLACVLLCPCFPIPPVLICVCNVK